MYISYFPQISRDINFRAEEVAKIKLTIFAHDGCAKIKTCKIRFFKGVQKLKPM